MFDFGEKSIVVVAIVAAAVLTVFEIEAGVAAAGFEWRRGVIASHETRGCPFVIINFLQVV